MRTVIVLLAVVVWLTGCTTGGLGGKMTIGEVSYKNASNFNPRWFDQSSSKNVCYSVITDTNSGLTAIPMSWHRTANDPHDSATFMMMYNPENARFALFYSGEPNLADCNNLRAIFFDRRVNLFTVLDPEWKAALNHPTANNIRPIVDFILDFGDDDPNRPLNNRYDGTRLSKQNFAYAIEGDRIVQKSTPPKVALFEHMDLPAHTGTPVDPAPVFAELKGTHEQAMALLKNNKDKIDQNAAIAQRTKPHFVNDPWIPLDVDAFMLEVTNQAGCNADQASIVGPTPTNKAGENLWVITTGPGCMSSFGKDSYQHQTALIYDDYNQIIWWSYGSTEADAQMAKSHFDDQGNRPGMLQYEAIMKLKDKYGMNKSKLD